MSKPIIYLGMVHDQNFAKHSLNKLYSTIQSHKIMRITKLFY